MRNRPDYKQRQDQQIESSEKTVDLLLKEFFENKNNLPSLVNAIKYFLYIKRSEWYSKVMGMIDPELLLHMQNNPGYLKLVKS